jgi:hypothetical protein
MRGEKGKLAEGKKLQIVPTKMREVQDLDALGEAMDTQILKKPMN